MNRISPFLKDVCQEMQKGALNGAKAGLWIGGVLLGSSVFETFYEVILEKANIPLGKEQTLSLFKNCCMIEEVRDWSICTNPASNQLRIYVVCATTGGGTVMGALAGTVKGVFKSKIQQINYYAQLILRPSIIGRYAKFIRPIV